MRAAHAAADSPHSGWHRKWLLLCAALVWIYFLRFRLLGWMLSQAVTLVLHAKAPRLKARAQIQYVTLRPLQIGHMEISSADGDWRFVCTRVAVETHVVEFFRSFVQKKILVIAIEDVYVDLMRLDEELVREVVCHSKPSTARPHADSPKSTEAERNQLGFMRFVDFQVRKISANIDAFETHSRFRCSDLCVNIPEVYLEQNILHLSVAASSVFVASKRQARRGSSDRRRRSFTRRENNVQDEISCELANVSAVLDIQLTDQEVIGCNLESNATDPAHIRISTSYLEHLLRKKMELIRRGLLPIPKWVWFVGDGDSTAGSHPMGPKVPRFVLRFVDFPVVVDLNHKPPGDIEVPLQVSARIRLLKYAKGGVDVCGQRPANDQVVTNKCREGIQMMLDWQHLEISSDSSTANVLSINHCRVEMSRDDSGRGSMQCQLGEMEMAVDPAHCKVLHSLMVFPDVIDGYERSTLLLMLEHVSQKCGRQLLVPTRKPSIQWNISVKVDSWSLRSWLISKAQSESHDLEATGQKTVLRCIIPPKKSGFTMTNTVDIAEVSARIAVQHGEDSHLQLSNNIYTLRFVDLSVSTAKILPPPGSTKSMEVKLSSSSVSLSGHSKNAQTEEYQFPALLITNFTFQQAEVESVEETNLTFKASASDVNIVTIHSRHNSILAEVQAVGDVLDQVRLMLTPPEPEHETETLPLPPVRRTVGVGMLASSIRVRVVDIHEVSQSVTFNVNETNVSFKRALGGVSNTITCAYLDMPWANNSSAMQATGIRFDQVVGADADDSILPLVEPSSQIDVSLSHLHLSLRPNCRFMMLFLKLDELLNPKDERTDSVPLKKASQQTVNLTCATMEIDVFADSSSHVVGYIGLDQLVVRANMLRSFQINDTVVRYLQLTRRDESCRTRLANCIQVVGVNGFLALRSIVVQSNEEEMLNLEELDIKFATTDVLLTCPMCDEKQLSSSYIPPKFLLFDLSASGKYFKVKLPLDSASAAKVILRVLQGALDTRPESVTVSTGESEFDDWRLRYVGSLDCGVEHAVAIIAIGRDVFHCDDRSQYAAPDRFVIIRADHVTFNTRQLQKLGLQFEVIRVVLADHDDDHVDISSDLRPISDESLPLQLAILPRTKIDAVIHWRPHSGVSRAQQFAVSFDLVLHGKQPLTTDQVPIAEETLVTLNWEYVFPLMIFLLTEEEYESDQYGSDAASDKTLECVGVQWNLSVDALQLAWWDAMTHDSAILIVCHDLLSHGLARVYQEGGKNPLAEPTWVLWESTVYLDLFRLYILREAHAEDELISLGCGALPFEPTQPSRFFFETTGTSYRATHAHCGDEVTCSDGSGALFGDLAFGVTDKLHDEFERVPFGFIVNSSNRLQRMDSTSIVSPESTTNGSPPKSPRAWTQTVRAKLARLKRRTASMDNMLLKDGSRPVQVDSMKMLWTLETRDCAFNMIAVTSDSIEVLRAASDRRRDQRGDASALPLHSQAPSTSSSIAERPQNAGSARFPTVEDLRSDGGRATRRGSTRETLLELLHQGKLGKKDSASLHRGDDPASPRQCDKSRSESEEMHLPKSIKQKLYTLDVHDAQINMLEEASRSSALIASKHIHLEVGTDEIGTTTIASLNFENVTGHVAPLDVEVSTGVAWYSYQKGSTQFPTSPRGTAPSPMLLKQVMEEFSLTSTYSQAAMTGATAVEVEMSSLQLSTDRHQFYQLLNVLRHVLLAPPTVIRRVKRTFTYRRDNPSESSTLSVDDIAIYPATSIPAAAAHSGKKLHAQLVEEMRLRDSKQLGTNRTTQVLLKLISFRSAGCVYRLRTSPESTGGDHEFVEIRAEGITGSHTYFLSQSTKLVINLEWMEINNLRPGSSSIAFEDPMAVLKAKLLVGQRYQSSSRSALTNQKGMLTVRAESGPQTRVLGQKLRVLDVLEVSIFPEIPNMIVIQLAADFYELVYKFFFEHIHTSEHQETHHAEIVLFGKKGSASSLSSMPIPIAVAVPQSPVTKSRAYTSPSSPPHPISIRRKSVQLSSAVTSTGSESALTASSLSIVTSPSGEAIADDEDSTADGHELYYFKYVRIGNVRLRINCNGFFVNLNNFDLDLPPYVCQSKLCTWKKLLQKFESHLKWHVTKETASTGLSHFKNKLLKWTPTAGDKKEKQKKEEDTATMNAQVLFGPYSGTN